MSSNLPPTSPEERSTVGTPGEDGSLGSIGPYRLRRKIGEGGMGEVYEAEQTEPVRRRVAVKVIKRGMDTKQLVARFEAERQALAIMDHPNIAKVYDAGETSDGRPYFVMEFVQGVPVNEYCDRHRLTTHERLALFTKVCEGVQHAHHKAIIHRDIKPSNVLVAHVDDKPVPRIIDFGIAKAMQQPLTAKTLYTEMGVLVGTPEYMSPEQAEVGGVDVDTRTDVYALGVVLYQLLTGALPFDSKTLRAAGHDEIRRRIREDEPAKPSTRIVTLGDGSKDTAAKRHTEPRSLARELRGELDWITMRALEKDRARRYDSPAALSDDVRRHLANEPVLAGPPSAVYRARRFVRRHRAGVAVATTAAVVLVGFAVAMGVSARKIAVERDLVERARADLETVVAFQSDMLAEMDTEGVGARLVEDLERRVAEAARADGLSDAEAASVARSVADGLWRVNATDVALRLIDQEILGRAVETLDAEFADAPRIDAKLRSQIGTTYVDLGLPERAVPLLERGVELARETLGPDDPGLLRSEANLAMVYATLGRFDDAEPLLRAGLERHRAIYGEDHEDTLSASHNLAELYMRLGRFEEAEALHLATLEGRRRVLRPDDARTFRSMSALASLYVRQSRFDEAEPLHREAVEEQSRVLGSDHPSTLTAKSALTRLLANLERYDEAEALGRETMEAQRRILGGEHPSTLASANTLAVVYRYQGRYGESEALYRQTLEGKRRTLGDDHPGTLASVVNLGEVLDLQGRFDEAEPLYLGALAGFRNVLGDTHPTTLTVISNVGLSYLDRDRYEEAESLFVEALDGNRSVFGADHPGALDAMHGLVRLYLARRPRSAGDVANAIALATDLNEQSAFEEPRHLRMLAAAQCASGLGEEAVATQRAAISFIEAEEERSARYEQELARFRQGCP